MVWLHSPACVDEARATGGEAYGEDVSACEGIDVDALTSRALRRARSYFDLTEPNVDMTLARQEWACLETGKISRPLLAHVTLHVDPQFDA